MNDRVEQVRALILGQRAGRNSGAVRYPVEVREEITSYARGCMAEGQRLGAVAASLDLSTTTIRRWFEEQSEPGALRPVVVKRSGAARRFSCPGAVLISPQRYRVEGLSLEALAQVLGALG